MNGGRSRTSGSGGCLRTFPEAGRISAFDLHVSHHRRGYARGTEILDPGSGFLFCLVPGLVSGG